ncbi:MAG: hypothetical protein HYV35_08575 [Lentisphaerae bacterium]|nr:hypothetical protein [Lentisphaerota bacterium]
MLLKPYRIILGALVLFALGPAPTSWRVGEAGAATVTWLTPSGTNYWDVATNWVGDAVPTNGDDVVIATNNIGVLLTNSTPELSSLLISNKATLIFSNWNTTLTASNVTVATSAVLTCVGSFGNSDMSNNVYIVCTNLFINSGGKIDVDGAGYKGGVAYDAGHGPGGGLATDTRSGPGASHGGFGGSSAYDYGPVPYGSVTNPFYAGSGGAGGQDGPGTNGGGAIRIEATDLVTVNGTISANGKNTAFRGGGGSGGSIYIACARLAATNGGIRAIGGNLSTSGGGGAGGRIAIHFNPAAQQSVPKPILSLLAAPSSSGSLLQRGDIGTLYMTDGSLLPETFTSITGQVYLGSSWMPGSFTLSNCWVRFPDDAFELRVTNNVTVIGSSARLDLGGNKYLRTSPTVFYSTNIGPRLYVGGNLILTNSGAMYVFCGMTNVVNTETGALVNVTGNMYVGTGSWVYLQSHVANGGSARFLMDSLVIIANAGFNADARGFAGGNLPGIASYIGLGPGRGYGEYRFMGTGGGYGGSGGRSSDGNPPGGYSGTYGSSNAPVDAGSGGGGRDVGLGGCGGGLISIRATNSISHNGTITANGQTPSGYGSTWGGGGSGGGIYLYARSFLSTNASAIIRANGGNADSATYGGGGGGGRIAIWRMYDRSGGITPTVTAGMGYSNGVSGTIFWGQIPLPGTIFSFK